MQMEQIQRPTRPPEQKHQLDPWCIWNPKPLQAPVWPRCLSADNNVDGSWGFDARGGRTRQKARWRRFSLKYPLGLKNYMLHARGLSGSKAVRALFN